jgi:hypothetical protein
VVVVPVWASKHTNQCGAAEALPAAAMLIANMATRQSPAIRIDFMVVHLLLSRSIRLGLAANPGHPLRRGGLRCQLPVLRLSIPGGRFCLVPPGPLNASRSMVRFEIADRPYQRLKDVSMTKDCFDNGNLDHAPGSPAKMGLSASEESTSVRRGLAQPLVFGTTSSADVSPRAIERDLVPAAAECLRFPRQFRQDVSDLSDAAARTPERRLQNSPSPAPAWRTRSNSGLETIPKKSVAAPTSTATRATSSWGLATGVADRLPGARLAGRSSGCAGRAGSGAAGGSNSEDPPAIAGATSECSRHFGRAQHVQRDREKLQADEQRDDVLRGGEQRHPPDRGEQQRVKLAVRGFLRGARAPRRKHRSIGSVGDGYDNALAEATMGLYKTDLINPQRPWNALDEVEFATLDTGVGRLVQQTTSLPRTRGGSLTVL